MSTSLSLCLSISLDRGHGSCLHRHYSGPGSGGETDDPYPWCHHQVGVPKEVVGCGLVDPGSCPGWDRFGRPGGGFVFSLHWFLGPRAPSGGRTVTVTVPGRVESPQ